MNDDNKKILIVDDDSNILSLIQTILDTEGYEIVTANDGIDALEKVKEKQPDLILLDVMLPHKNGFEVCKDLKECNETQFIPIVLITGLSKKEDKIAGIEAGADDFLTKPIDKRELLVRIKSLLRIKSLHEEIEKKNLLLTKVLNLYVADEVSELIINNPEKHLKLGGEKRHATVLFLDIRGFTGYSEQQSPEKIVELLNIIFSALIKIIFKYKGVIGKYLGDGMMAYYNTPEGDTENILKVLKTAIEMKNIFFDLKNDWATMELNTLGMGIGINTGDVILGNIGSEKMMDYTVIGDTVNVAHRLQSFASSEQILISQNTYQAVKNHVKVNKLPLMQLKGRQQQVASYELLEITS